MLRRLDDFSERLDANTDSITALRIGTFSLANSINTLEDTVAIDLSAVQAAVEANTSVDASAETLLSELSAKISDLAAQLANEPAVQQALNDLAAGLTDSNNGLAAAVAANTPADTGGGTPTP